MSFRRSTLFAFFIMILILYAEAVKDTAEIESRNPPGTNPPARLKHLTPIAGTNLFLNVPYKMLDRKRGACYGMWFYTDRNYLGQMDKRLTFTCDQQWYDTENASWLFERTDGSESIDEYKGPVIVRNLGSKETLDTYGVNGRYTVLRAVVSLRSVKWTLRSDPSDMNNLQLEFNGWYLFQRPANNLRINVALVQGYNPDGYRYSFVPVIEIESRMYNFVFAQLLPDQIAQHTTKKALLDSYDIINNSSATQSKTIAVSEKVSAEFSLGFSQSFQAFKKCSGRAVIPILSDAKGEYGFEFTLSPNDKWKISDEKVFSMSYDVNIPSNTNVRVSAWYDRVEDIRINYTTEAEITGKCTRITVSDEDVPDSPATGEIILKQLQQSQFDGTIVQVKKESVIVQMKGTMVASAGVRGQLNVDGKTVAKQSVPK